MSKNNVICLLHDDVADNFSAPITFANEAAATRHLANVAKQDPFAKDYSLYAVADYDSEQGLITAYNAQKLLARGIDYVKKN